MERAKEDDPRRQFEGGLYGQCLQSCQGIYRTRPADVDNLLLLAACHFQLNHMQESMFYAKQAIGVDPQLVEAMLTLGNALRELGNVDAAAELYNAALKIRPRFAHAYAALGCVHAQRGRRDEARGCFEMAATLDPSFKRYHGLALVAAGDRAGGKAALSLLAESDALACLGLGNLAHDEGDADAAAALYARALRLAPSFVGAATNLCGAQLATFERTRDRAALRDATARLARTAASFPRSRAAHSKLGLCHRHEGRRPLARHHLWRAVALDPTDAIALCHLAAFHVEAGDDERAARLCLRALRYEPRCAAAFGTLGLAFFQMGATEDALRCLRVARRLEPCPAVCANLGAVWNELGDSLEAAKLCKRAIALDPFNIPAFLNMGNGASACGPCRRTAPRATRCSRHHVVSLLPSRTPQRTLAWAKQSTPKNVIAPRSTLIRNGARSP